MKRRVGFTIVEILVVVVILSILASIAIVNFRGVQAQGRDNQRKTDVLLLKSAIEKYNDANGFYPLPSGCTDGSGCAASLLSSVLVPTYLSSIPASPSGTNYSYVRGSAASLSYAILVTMEEAPTCKTGTKVSTGWWGTGVPLCQF